MRLVIQRVKEARVDIDGKLFSAIKKGLLVFVAVAKEDSFAQCDYLAEKTAHLRIFEDNAGKMNLSVIEVGAEILVVSQFTLLGDCVKGRRPSFDAAAEAQKGEELYEYFVAKLKEYHPKVSVGRFKARMDVSLVNDGPVTLILDSKA